MQQNCLSDSDADGVINKAINNSLSVHTREENTSIRKDFIILDQTEYGSKVPDPYMELVNNDGKWGKDIKNYDIEN